MSVVTQVKLVLLCGALFSLFPFRSLTSNSRSVTFTAIKFYPFLMSATLIGLAGFCIANRSIDEHFSGFTFVFDILITCFAITSNILAMILFATKYFDIFQTIFNDFDHLDNSLIKLHKKQINYPYKWNLLIFIAVFIVMANGTRV